MPIVTPKRCACYTRKSVEEGLDMEFNTLDAQREACESYIASQKSNGWICLPQRYDDSGFSGWIMEESIEFVLKEAKIYKKSKKKPNILLYFLFVGDIFMMLSRE